MGWVIHGDPWHGQQIFSSTKYRKNFWGPPSNLLNDIMAPYQG